MGLFGKKEPCVFCGEKVKGLFPHKIEGQLVCNACHGIVDLPSGWEQNMTIEKFRRYMQFREENNRQKEGFQVNRKVDFGFFDTKMVFDYQKKAFCMSQDLTTTQKKKKEQFFSAMSSALLKPHGFPTALMS